MAKRMPVEPGVKHEELRNFPCVGSDLKRPAPISLDRNYQGAPAAMPGLLRVRRQHLGGGVVLRQLSDFRGEELINRVLNVVRRYRPLHLSIVGGEPLVRYRELGAITGTGAPEDRSAARHER